MTSLLFTPAVGAVPVAAAPCTPARSGRLLRGLRLGRKAAAAPQSATALLRLAATRTPLACGPRGRLELTLQDGRPCRYLLDPGDFATTTSPDVAYDVRVRAAYVLALQGHRPEWLAQRLDLPQAAAERIAEHAERSGGLREGSELR